MLPRVASHRSELVKKLVLTASCALAIAACDDAIDRPLTNFLPDGTAGGAVNEPCNPLTQASCAEGEKCAQLVVTEGPPALATATCVPDGTVIAGGRCIQGKAGPNGYDDCVAGYHCLRGQCVEICSSAGGDTCRTPEQGFGVGQYCTLYDSVFSDKIGLCADSCNPTDDTVNAETKRVTNTSCGEGSGCYLNPTRGVAACVHTPDMASTVAQGDTCYGPQAGSCYINGCGSGYMHVLKDKTCSRYLYSC